LRGRRCRRGADTGKRDPGPRGALCWAASSPPTAEALLRAGGDEGLDAGGANVSDDDDGDAANGGAGGEDAAEACGNGARPDGDAGEQGARRDGCDGSREPGAGARDGGAHSPPEADPDSGAPTANGDALAPATSGGEDGEGGGGGDGDGDDGGGGGGGRGGGQRRFPKTRLWRQSQDRHAWRSDVLGAGTAARVAFNAVRPRRCGACCTALS